VIDVYTRKWQEDEAREQYDSAINVSRNSSYYPVLEERLSHAITTMRNAANLYMQLNKERWVNRCSGWIAFWESRMIWDAALKKEDETEVQDLGQKTIEKLDKAIEFFAKSGDKIRNRRMLQLKEKRLGVLAQKRNDFAECKVHQNKGLAIVQELGETNQIFYYYAWQKEVEAWELAFSRFMKLDNVGGEIFQRISDKLDYAENAYREAKDIRAATYCYAWKNLFRFCAQPTPENMRAWHAFTSNFDIKELTSVTDRILARKKLKKAILFYGEDLHNVVLTNARHLYICFDCLSQTQELEEWLLQARKKIDQRLFTTSNGRDMSASLEKSISIFESLGVHISESIRWATFEINMPWKHGALADPAEFEKLKSKAITNEKIIYEVLPTEIQHLKSEIKRKFSIEFP